MKIQFVCCDNCGCPAEHIHHGRSGQQTACPHCDYFGLIKEGRVVLWQAPGLDPAQARRMPSVSATAAPLAGIA